MGRPTTFFPILIYLLVFIPAVCKAQTYYVNVKTFGQSDGFGTSDGAIISHDRKGFIWISTRNGLYRFNGTNLKLYTYSATVSNGLPSNTFTFCYQDKDGDYWVGISGKGLYRFDDKTEKFTPWQNRNPEEIDMTHLYNVIAPFEDSHGVLWVSAATKGIVRIDKKNRTVKLFNVCDQANPQDLYRSCRWVNQFSEDNDGWFWLCSNSGLIHFNPADGRFEVFRNGGEFTGYFKDSEGKHWIGSWAGGLKSFNPSTKEWKQYTWTKKTDGVSNIVSGILEKDKDHLWIATVDAGLLIFEKSTSRFIPVRSQSPAENFLNTSTSMTADRSGNLWIMGENQFGRINSKEIFHYTYIGNPKLGRPKIVSAFLHPPGDSLVFAAAIYSKEGLNLYNLKTRNSFVIRLKQTDEDENIVDIFADYNKRIWISTQNGIYLLDRNTLSPKHFNPPSVEFSNYFSRSFTKTFEDQNHRLWFASRWKGLFCYDEQKQTMIRYSSDSTGSHHIPSDQIEFAFADHRGNIWLAIHAYLDNQPTVFCITSEGKLVSYTGKIPLDAAYQVIETRSKKIMVATGRSGLFEIRNPLQPNEAIKQYSEGQGISSGYTEGLTEDKDGNIWIATHNGLSCLTSSGIINFDRNDGLASLELTGHPYCDEENNIFLPYQDRFQYFNADSLLNYYSPVGNVILEALTINQKPYSGDPAYLQALSLDYDQNNLSFEFAAFDLSQGDKLQYRYKLKGSDTKWNLLGKNRRLFLSTLAAGHYTLQLQAGDRYGNWSNQMLTLPITIHPPFWKTGWFYALCALAFASLVYFIYKIRINALLAEQKLRNKIARDLHDDIGSTLSGIKLFSSMAQNKLVEEKSSAVNIIERIGERSEKMIDAMSDIVWSINPTNDTIENMLVRMKQYAAEMMEPKNISYQFLVNEKVAKIKIGLETRKDIYLIFKESINNAVKYSNCNNITIHINAQRRHLTLTISDDGIGFDEEKLNGNGNGVKNLRERAKAIGGEITIASQQNKGTSIELKVPVT